MGPHGAVEPIFTDKEYEELEQRLQEFAQRTDPLSGEESTLIEPNTSLVQAVRTWRADNTSEECPGLLVQVPLPELDHPIIVSDFDREYEGVFVLEQFNYENPVSPTALNDLSPACADFEDEVLDMFCHAYGFSRDVVEDTYQDDLQLTAVAVEDGIVEFVEVLEQKHVKKYAP